MTNVAAMTKVQEEIAIGVSDRPYVAEYVRQIGAAEDPAAARERGVDVDRPRNLSKAVAEQAAAK